MNAEPFTPRYWYKDPNRFFDIPAIDPATPPEGVSAEAWAQFAALAGTQTLWSLTMIARVFYAAAASRSAIIEAHPQDTHIGFCRMKNVCPACAGQIDTIFETRQSMSTFTPSAEQAAIIDAPVDADVLVVAGAGSGKTFTMTQRIIALINRGVAPERILGLTFTRKAAGELLERVSAAVAGDMAGSTTATVSDRAFLKPAIFTYDAFFQTIVRQYGLLVGFDQNTQPLSAAGALQLATEVIDSHLDLAFSEDFGAFSSLANRVLALSDAIGSAMIGAGCTSFDDAINRVRQWDSAFINRLQQAVADEPMPEDEPKIPKIKRLKKDTDASWQAKLDDRAEHLHARCTYHCGALLETTRKRDILLQLVEAYAQAKRERTMAEFSDFTIAAYQLIERFPSIGERTRRRYSHVLLDEYQDTSTTQAALLAALFHVDASQRSAVNAVGDPFQSIYAWRGASPGAFRMFQQDFHLSAGYKPFPLSVTSETAV